MYKGRRKGVEEVLRGIRIISPILLMLVVVVGLWMGENYKKSYYLSETTIHGIDCSKLTVEDAKTQIEEANVVFQFVNGVEHVESGKNLGREISDASELEEFLKFQHSKEGKDVREVTLTPESFYVDEEELRSYLKGVSQLKAENMQKPVDSKLFIGSTGFIEATSHAEGNEIDFEKAFELAKNCLKNGEMVIDFTGITNVEPKVKSNDPELLQMRQRVNKILKSEITFTLTDGSTCILNIDTMKDWVYQDEEGNYQVKFDENLEAFIDTLDNKVKEAGAELEVKTVSEGTVKLPVDWENRNAVDKEAELAQITKELQNGEKVTRDPIYSRLNLLDEFSSYIEVDLKNQRVYMYVDGKLLLDKPCVTGTANTKRATPTGVYHLLYKQTDKDFKTYGGHSDFWMQFTNTGVGFHDATWRADSDFVPETYLTRGSHGCVNLQWQTAKTMYENITYQMPIIVH